MKFENSTFEERYNDYWNGNVVRLDSAIRRCTLGLNLFEMNSSVHQLIEAYQQHVLNILSNLKRQMGLFEDKEYVKEYIKNTVSQTIEDLSYYQHIFPEYKEIPNKFLITLNKFLPEETAKNIGSHGFI
ncbi:hypothetical protein [Legionella sp. WA2022007384]